MEYGVVILSDALGMKGIWKREDPDNLVRRWEDLCQDSLNSSELHNFFSSQRVKYGKAVSNVQWDVSMFSDTIVVTGILSEGAEPPFRDVFGILFDGAMFLDKMIGFNIRKNIRLRGALSFGQLTRGKHIIVGPAVDDAAAWYEKADWIGGILTPSTAAVIKQRYDQGDELVRWHDDLDFWLWWRVPLKDGDAVETYAVGWPWSYDLRYWTDGVAFSPRSRADLLDLLRDMREGGTDLKRKHDNTVAFYDAYRKRHFDPDEKPGERLRGRPTDFGFMNFWKILKRLLARS